MSSRIAVSRPIHSLTGMNTLWGSTRTQLFRTQCPIMRSIFRVVLLYNDTVKHQCNARKYSD